MAHNSKPGPTTEESLQTVYTNLKNKISGKNQIKLSQKTKQAKQLQDFLNDLIGISEDDSIPSDFIEGIRAQLGLNGLNILKSKTGSGFEERLFNVIEATFQVAEQQKYIKNLTNNTGVGMLGTSQTQIPDIDDMTREMIKNNYIAVGDYIKNNFMTKQSGKKSIYGSVDGKIDVSGLGYTFTLSMGLNRNVKELLTLLQKATFTAKNYSKPKLKIGSYGANAYRTFISAFSAAGIENPNTVFWRMIQCLNHHKELKTMKLAYGIRLIYELTGIGQEYLDQNIQDLLKDTNGAEFLIFYNKGEDTVTVKSTAEILTEYLDDKTWLDERIEELGYSPDRVLYSQIKIVI